MKPPMNTPSNLNRRHILGILATGLAAGPLASTASAQTFPARVITIVVPFPAGGTTDITARILALEMSAQFGQTVIVENKAGANGNIGCAQVAIRC
jgi:tripartite-type tricarboxylate transporter receptor subunit TctC